MVVRFSDIDFYERPILILKNAGDTPLGVLGYAKNVSADLKYNETSSIEFEVPEFVDGEATPFYDDIVGMRTVELLGVGQFTLMSPSERGDGVQKMKTCMAYSLEYEFAYKKISIPEGTYKFWDAADPGSTLLGMIMELMPSWSIGAVSAMLQNKYRTFEVNNENLYNLIKGTIQESYGCVFDFDTMNRKVYVRDASDTPANQPVFLSTDNLAREIEVTENTEDIFTRLDVNGAEGVTIRDVNPTGTNKIINLDYYMTEDNFPQALIEKYEAWKQECEENRTPYYVKSVQYAMKTAQRESETAKLTDLRGEMTNLENLQAVAISAIAQGIDTQQDLDEANANIAAKQIEIDAKQAAINALQTELDIIYAQLQTITQACSFEGYFTDAEYRLLDRYIKDGDITETSFVAAEMASFDDLGSGSQLGSVTMALTGGTVTQIDSTDGNATYDARGGQMSIGNDLSADVISAIVDRRTNGSFVMTAYLSSGSIESHSFSSACVSLTGNSGAISTSAGTTTINVTNAYRYFSLNASEYEKRSVAWELFEYGEEALNKLSVPSYSFKVTSANFFVLDEFETFKNALTLGEKIYIDLGKRGVLQPIVIGVRFSFDDPGSMELLFGDSYSDGDSTFRLTDLLEQSISMGKNVEMSRFAYSAFTDSGASSELRSFMTSALDVAKNTIMSSTGQAVSWDGAGLRLRKWANTAQTTYEPEQIWMNNNSIVMTSDNWATAQMAIGKFHDANLGDCWGIVAPNVVGTLLAGSSLVIESELKDGGIATFKMDADGCRLYNSQFEVHNDATHIILSPDIGIALGTYPVYETSEGEIALDEDNAKFWVDTSGDLHFKGTLHGANGDFTGTVVATSLIIRENNIDISASDYIEDVVDEATAGLAEDIQGIADGSTGIYFANSSVGSVTINSTVGLKIVGTDNTYFQAKNNAMGFFKSNGTPMLYYQNGNIVLSGVIQAAGGYIGGAGGWVIGNNCIYNGTASALGSAGGIYMGTTGISVGSAIEMRPDGTFIIRSEEADPNDPNNFVLKITPEVTSDGDKVYRMMLGSISFDESFVLPTENGGTGGITRASIGSTFGLHRALSTDDMNRLNNVLNGDLCVIYSDGNEGATVSGTNAGAVITNWNTTQPSQTAWGNVGTYYWQVSSLSAETIDTSYARVGVGYTVGGACAVRVPMNISVANSSGGITNVNLSFTANCRPAGARRDLSNTRENGITIAICDASGNICGKINYRTPAFTTTDQDQSCNVTIHCDAPISSGTYYAVFYSRAVKSLVWIKHATVNIPTTSIGAAAGLYLRTGGVWRAVAAVS